ncbi:transposase [Kitasatospora sp. NPDC048545]|uniref:transposase n=1 Tax=Kitasatospora sp. NPDC048545 TaxID=3157208 RepID=UPI0033D470C2
MSDAKWAVVRDAMPVPAWLEGRGGQPEGYCHRQLVDAVRYLVAGGIAWRAVPADFPACRRSRNSPEVAGSCRRNSPPSWSRVPMGTVPGTRHTRCRHPGQIRRA